LAAAGAFLCPLAAGLRGLALLDKINLL
jgi:hypothetical protein